MVSLIGIALLLAACEAESQPSQSSNQSSHRTIAGWGVVYGINSDVTGSDETYNLGLVAPDGRVLASLTPGRQYHVFGQLRMGQDVELQLRPFAASADRLYYFDGLTLKYVTADGAAATVRAFEGAKSEYAIAVTPDNTRIAVARFDYATSPPTYDLTVQDLNGGHRVRLSDVGLRYAWPLGWAGSRLIVAAERSGYSMVSSEGVFMGGGGRTYMVDATTGVYLGTLCSRPVAEHALCRDDSDSSLFVESWDGTRVPQRQLGPAGCFAFGVLSPDGTTIASTDEVVATPGGCVSGRYVTLTDAVGGRRVLPVPGWPDVFIDSGHLIYETAPEMGYRALNLLDLRTGATHRIDFMEGHCRYCYAFGVSAPA